MGFTQNILANTLLHTYTQLIVLKSRFQSHAYRHIITYILKLLYAYGHALLTKERILILSSSAWALQLKQG